MWLCERVYQWTQTYQIKNKFGCLHLKIFNRITHSRELTMGELLKWNPTIRWTSKLENYHLCVVKPFHQKRYTQLWLPMLALIDRVKPYAPRIHIRLLRYMDKLTFHAQWYLEQYFCSDYIKYPLKYGHVCIVRYIIQRTTRIAQFVPTHCLHNTYISGVKVGQINSIIFLTILWFYEKVIAGLMLLSTRIYVPFHVQPEDF